MKKVLYLVALLACTTMSLTGCWLAAGAVGAEAGYIASQEDRSTGETIDDQLILSSVKSRLLADSEVSGLDINVDVFKSNVTLRGYVKTQREIDHAIQIARNTRGVHSVESKLVLDRQY